MMKCVSPMGIRSLKGEGAPSFLLDSDDLRKFANLLLITSAYLLICFRSLIGALARINRPDAIHERISFRGLIVTWRGEGEERG